MYAVIPFINLLFCVRDESINQLNIPRYPPQIRTPKLGGDEQKKR